MRQKISFTLWLGKDFTFCFITFVHGAGETCQRVKAQKENKNDAVHKI